MRHYAGGGGGLALLVAVGLAACADPTAIRSFAEQAPETTKLQPLLAGWESSPKVAPRYNVEALRNAGDAATDTASAKARESQVSAFTTVNDTVVAYMKALGSLADDKLVKTDTSKLKSGLGGLKSAAPSLRITDPEIAAITAVVQFIADAGERLYRQAELAKIIGEANSPFQMAVNTEQRIISDIILKEMIEEEGPSIKMLVDNLESSRRAIAESAGGQSKFHGLEGLQSTSEFLVAEKQDELQSNLDARIAAARTLVKVLDDLGKAHQKLYEQRNDVLTRGTFEQVRPLLEDAKAAFEAINKV